MKYKLFFAVLIGLSLLNPLTMLGHAELPRRDNRLRSPTEPIGLVYSGGSYPIPGAEEKTAPKIPETLSNLFAAAITPCGCADDAANIQQALDALPLTGGSVYLRAGIYLLNQGIHIKRSNVTLLGETGTLLQLGPNVNQPVVLIGSDVETPTPNDIIQNIRIGYMEIDGNKANQISENVPAKTWIRNNGVDVRGVAYLWVENMNVHNARSGGIVVSWFSQRITISNSSFHDNFFDGIALYDSKNILISNFFSYANSSAGLSLDANLEYVSLFGGYVADNDIGVFIRNAMNVNLNNIMVFGNRKYGSYLAIVQGLFFQGCGFYNNKGHGIWLESTVPGSNNAVVGCLFSNNGGNCIQDDTGGGLAQTANICPSGRSVLNFLRRFIK
ncbi:MAG: hypothetical protein C4519_13025 [Desulfobacteraceae bacterium]|nr:MAG: hypothetical protein C4519_13025 [Desulfobacteraceae bacterium]